MAAQNIQPWDKRRNASQKKVTFTRNYHTFSFHFFYWLCDFFEQVFFFFSFFFLKSDFSLKHFLAHNLKDETKKVGFNRVLKVLEEGKK